VNGSYGWSTRDIALKGVLRGTATDVVSDTTITSLYLPNVAATPQIEAYTDATTYTTYGPVYALTRPNPVSSWTWVNQGAATATDQVGGGIFISAPTGAGNNVRALVTTAPSPPYSVVAGLLPALYPGTNPLCGILFRASGAGTLAALCLQSLPKVTVNKYTSPTAFSATYFNPSFSGSTAFGSIAWLKIEDNNTNRICSISSDGVNFIPIHSVVRTDFLTADQIGFFAESNDANGQAGVTLLSWRVF